MNGKFLLIFFIIANILVLALGYAQYNVAPDIITKQEIAEKNIILAGLFNINADSFSSDSQVAIDDNLQTAVADLNKPKSGFAAGSSASTGLSFIDVVQLVFSVLSLLTPIPIVTFVYSLSLPILPMILIGVVSTMLYILALVEFFKGSGL